MEDFKKIFAFLFLGFIALLIASNYFGSKYAKYKIEKVLSETLNQEVTVGSAIFKYPPFSIVLDDVNIIKNDYKNPLKGFDAKIVEASFDFNSLFTDLILIKNIKIINPIIVYDIAGLGISDSDKQELENDFIGPELPDLDIIVKGEGGAGSMQVNATLQDKIQLGWIFLDSNPFIANELFISGAKLFPIGSDLNLIAKLKDLDLPDIKIDIVDNASGPRVVEHVNEVIRDSVKSKLSPKKTDYKKDKKAEEQNDDEIKDNQESEQIE